MVKNQWLKLSLFSFVGILVVWLLERVFSPGIPQGMQMSGMGMGQGMMGPGMGMAQGMMGGVMGGTSGTFLGSFFEFLLNALTVLAVLVLLVGIVGFIYSYLKGNETKVEKNIVENDNKNITVEGEDKIANTAVEYLKRNFLTKSETTEN
ncbi:hypothetical protein [Effusibacillus consociatus]|uniref:Uncharacterized protein n=1 Tax=Effusibacillus consociatus TaxID=1117041 RepID=A0ABV9Q1N2_9BACL